MEPARLRKKKRRRPGAEPARFLAQGAHARTLDRTCVSLWPVSRTTGSARSFVECMSAGSAELVTGLRSLPAVGAEPAFVFIR